jgi:hypothetical protein
MWLSQANVMDEQHLDSFYRREQRHSLIRGHSCPFVVQTSTRRRQA